MHLIKHLITQAESNFSPSFIYSLVSSTARVLWNIYTFALLSGWYGEEFKCFILNLSRLIRIISFTFYGSLFVTSSTGAQYLRDTFVSRNPTTFGLSYPECQSIYKTVYLFLLGFPIWTRNVHAHLLGDSSPSGSLLTVVCFERGIIEAVLILHHFPV